MKLSETIVIVLAVLAMAVALLSGLGYANYLISKTACDQMGRRLRVMTVYEYPSGCYKIVNGQWTPVVQKLENCHD